jgi:DNA-binding transcriptional ArsR family regulator
MLHIMARQGTELPPVLELKGSAGLKLLTHEARQRVISEIYDGRELTATEAAELCGLTPSAMSYHLRMLVRAGVLVPAQDNGDGRERRYRRAARELHVIGSGSRNRVEMQATTAIWVDSLARAVQRWLATDDRRQGGMSNLVLRLTEQQNAELLERLQGVFATFTELSDANAPEVPQWEHYWAHVPKIKGAAAAPHDGTDT